MGTAAIIMTTITIIITTELRTHRQQDRIMCPKTHPIPAHGILIYNTNIQIYWYSDKLFLYPIDLDNMNEQERKK